MNAATSPSTNTVMFRASGCWNACASISSFDQNPESGTMPASERLQTTITTYVIRMWSFKPPRYRILKVPPAWCTDPAARNSPALKNACVNRWNTAAPYAPMPNANIM